MKKNRLVQWLGMSVLATAGLAAHAAGPDWSLIISGPSIVIPPAPAPVQVAPVQLPIRVAPVQTAPVTNQPLYPINDTPKPMQVPPPRYENNWERERADYDRRFSDRENYYLEREKAYQARERAFIEREKQRLLVVENNQRASQAINDRQDQLLDRIVEGVNLNRISKEEFSALMSQLKQIREQERAFLVDGFMSQEEYQQLTAALNNVEQAIRYNRRSNNNGRYPQVPVERQFYPQPR